MIKCINIKYRMIFSIFCTVLNTKLFFNTNPCFLCTSKCSILWYIQAPQSNQNLKNDYIEQLSHPSQSTKTTCCAMKGPVFIVGNAIFMIYIFEIPSLVLKFGNSDLHSKTHCSHHFCSVLFSTTQQIVFVIKDHPWA